MVANKVQYFYSHAFFTYLTLNITGFTNYVDNTSEVNLTNNDAGLAMNIDEEKETTLYSNEELFEELRDNWHKERGVTSSGTIIINCESYKKIIRMGKEIAVPLIINQLKKEGNTPDFWFYALNQLTGVNPITENEKGNRIAIAKSWIKWAEGK